MILLFDYELFLDVDKKQRYNNFLNLLTRISHSYGMSVDFGQENCLRQQLLLLSVSHSLEKYCNHQIGSLIQPLCGPKGRTATTAIVEKPVW